MTWMVYGAYGYTGRLVAALATERGEMPALRRPPRRQLRAIGEMLQLDHRAVYLATLRTARRARGLRRRCPLRRTLLRHLQPMVDACLATGTHYLDITGEIDVFEGVLARHDEAMAGG